MLHKRNSSNVFSMLTGWFTAVPLPSPLLFKSPPTLDQWAARKRATSQTIQPIGVLEDQCVQTRGDVCCDHATHLKARPGWHTLLLCNKILPERFCSGRGNMFCCVVQPHSSSKSNLKLYDWLDDSWGITSALGRNSGCIVQKLWLRRQKVN